MSKDQFLDPYLVGLTSIEPKAGVVRTNHEQVIKCQPYPESSTKYSSVSYTPLHIDVADCRASADPDIIKTLNSREQVCGTTDPPTGCSTQEIKL